MSDSNKTPEQIDFERRKVERMAKMRKKVVNNEVVEFIPTWLTEPIELQANSFNTPTPKFQAYTTEEIFFLNTLLSISEIKQKIKVINSETNFTEIQRLYNLELVINEDVFVKLKAYMSKNRNSFLKERRGPLIGMRTVALNKGLSVVQIQKSVRQLEEAECFEIFYYCLLNQKYTLYQKEIEGPISKLDNDDETVFDYTTSQEFKNKIWYDYKKNFFYDNIDYLHHLESEMEEYKDDLKPEKKKVEKIEILEEEVKFRPIVWSPEEMIDINTLRENINEDKVKLFDETKQPLVMIFIGHVDSGKSTICGSILQISGTINELEVNKLRQEAKGKGMESWYNAYVMDVIDEEKESGKTIEMGRAYFETAHKRFTILDCPGHKNFVQAMLGGAAQADIASLVISAKMGEFESGFEKEGQTREHAMLARSLGADYVIVLINKMDTVNWSQERYNYIKTSLTPFLEHNCGFDSSRIFWTVLSGLHQINMGIPMDTSLAPWFKGKSLFDTFDSLPMIPRSQNKILRIPLLDKLKDMGAIISSCKINSGIVKPNMTCVLMPIQKPIIISKVLDTNDCELGYAGIGESVTLHLKGVEEDEIKRGYVICGQQFWTNVCLEFEAEVHVFELLPNHCFGPGFTCMMHLHTALEEVSITSLSRFDEVDGVVKKVNAIALKSGQRGVVKLKSKNPICIEKYCDFSDLGRFALRKETITMAAGTILRFKPINPELLKNNNYFAKTEDLKSGKREDDVDDIC